MSQILEGGGKWGLIKTSKIYITKLNKFGGFIICLWMQQLFIAYPHVRHCMPEDIALNKIGINPHFYGIYYVVISHCLLNNQFSSK